MAHICYISRERVDTLFEQAFDGVVEEEVRETSEERSREFSAETDLALLQVLTGGSTFGKSSAASTQTKVRNEARHNAIDAFDKAVKRSHSH